MLRIKSPQDLGAAAVFISIGLAGAYFGSELRMGTAARMGPGYFPWILSWCIFAIGLILGGRSFALEGPPIERPQLRPILFIVLAILFFGYLIEHIGLVTVGIGMVFIAAYAQREVNLKSTAVLAAALTLFIIVVFVWTMHQPLPLWGI